MRLHPAALLAFFLLAVAAPACRATRDGQSSLRDEANPMPMSAADLPPEVPEPYVAINGYEIQRFEYWPFRWKDEAAQCVFPYPDLVQQGYDGGSPAAQNCMKQAYDTLWSILKQPPPALAELKAKGGPRQFFILVHDYTEAKVNPAGEPVASCLPEAAHRKIWHYSPPNGIIKWVNEVNKDGTCTLRTADDLAAFATDELKRRGD